MQHTCKQCGGGFESAPSQHRVYCSSACFSKSNAGESRQLQTADVNARRIATRLTSPKIGHKIEMTCDGCSTVFIEYPSKRPKPLKFCTRECGLAYQRTHGKGHVGNMDVDTAAPKKSAGPNMAVVADFSKKELRNE